MLVEGKKKQGTIRGKVIVEPVAVSGVKTWATVSFDNIPFADGITAADIGKYKYFFVVFRTSSTAATAKFNPSIYNSLIAFTTSEKIMWGCPSNETSSSTPAMVGGKLKGVSGSNFKWKQIYSDSAKYMIYVYGVRAEVVN